MRPVRSRTVQRCIALEAHGGNATRASIGENNGTPVLRTGEDDRVYDACDIPAIVGLITIELQLVHARARRLRRVRKDLLSFREAHLVEFGHEFGHGCCAPFPANGRKAR